MSKIKHLAFLNPHGKFDQKNSYRAEDPELKEEELYVKKLAQTLAKMGIQVDIISRQINDPDYPQFSELYDSYPDYDNLRIIRLPFGGDKFLAKEKLWPHLKEYIDAVADFYDEEGFFPDYFSTHYALGGLAGVLLKEKLEVPFSFTGQVLAVQKMEALNFRKENSEQLIKKFKLQSRLIAERLALSFANQIIVDSAQEEVDKYSHPYYQDIAEVDNPAKFTVISPKFNNTDSDFNNQSSALQGESERNEKNSELNKSYWQRAALSYLDAMEKSIDYEIPVGHGKIPAYFFLPDSENKRELLDKFYKKVFKK